LREAFRNPSPEEFTSAIRSSWSIMKAGTGSEFQML
jgi:hypothetical protein